MGAMASQITSLTSVYSTVYSGTDQRKHQSSASLAFVRGIHRWPLNSPHKGPVTRKMFPFDGVIIGWDFGPSEFSLNIMTHHTSFTYWGLIKIGDILHFTLTLILLNKHVALSTADMFILLARVSLLLAINKYVYTLSEPGDWISNRTLRYDVNWKICWCFRIGSILSGKKWLRMRIIE